MIFGTLPFISANEKELVRQITHDNVKFPKNYPITSEAKEIIKSMLQKDPTKRLELIELVQTPYNTMEEEEFQARYEETKLAFEE